MGRHITALALNEAMHQQAHPSDMLVLGRRLPPLSDRPRGVGPAEAQHSIQQMSQFGKLH